MQVDSDAASSTAGSQQRRSARPDAREEARWAELRRRARGILKESLAAFLSEEPPTKADERREWVRILGSWPFSLVEKELAGFLDDPAAEVKLAACETLIQHAADKYREKVLAALAELRSDDDQQQVRAVVVRFRLDDKKALQQVRDWATLQPYRIRLKEGAHWCPMDPQILKPKKGECPICRMSLVPLEGEIDLFSHLTEVSLLALEPLAERNDPVVPQAARRILVSNARASQRIQAAIHWARVAPREAEPHLRLFLTTMGAERGYTVNNIAHFVPKQFHPDLKQIAADQKESMEIRLSATAGLLKIGDREQLEMVRRVAAVKREENGFVQLHAIGLLANYGTKEDVERIAACLDGELRPWAAASLLHLLKRISP